ncbi:hypothetical protein [Streptomyces sp. NPDC088801]|uniref:hypothetical protein n=1 Tax=Streptomyces sp. NPDC088801 TaxID=3365903 RepID=UPI00381B3AF8
MAAPPCRDVAGHCVGQRCPDRLSARERKDALRQTADRRASVYARRAAAIAAPEA